jgi:hypothetical protein
MDRPSPSVGMNDHVRRNGSRQTEVVRGSEAVDEHTDLVAAGKGINDLWIVGDCWPLGQVVDPGRVVQPSVDASELPRFDKTLKCLINGVSTAEVEKIDRRPHLSRRSACDSVCDRTLQVHRPIFVRTFRTGCKLEPSDICRTNIGHASGALAFPNFRNSCGDHTLVAAHAFKSILQGPLLQDAKIGSDRLEIPPLLLIFGRD